MLPGEAGLAYVDRLRSGKVVNLIIQEAPKGVSVDTGVSNTLEEQEEIAEKVTWMLGLDLDFSDFYQLIAQEPRLANARILAQGRVLRSPTLSEDTVKTILTTNTVWGSTRRMVERLVKEFGSRLPPDPSLQAFPTPEQIACSDTTVLRSVIRLGYRAPYVHELGKRIAEGEIDLEIHRHSTLNTMELQKHLLGIKGVGKYAAANLLMLLGHYDFIPIDSWALKVVSHEWHSGEAIGPADVETAFERFGEWKGLAFWLWDWKINEN
jgi:3-methyladenine DNA glycosylase/8-oxoguanine DNA glycosylase